MQKLHDIMAEESIARTNALDPMAASRQLIAFVAVQSPQHLAYHCLRTRTAEVTKSDGNWEGYGCMDGSPECC